MIGLAGDRATVQARAPITALELEATIHIEVDLPVGGAGVLSNDLSYAGLMSLPAEVVVEFEMDDGMTLDLARIHDTKGDVAYGMGSTTNAGLGVSELKIQVSGATLAEVMELYPEGVYTIQGTTADGTEAIGSASLVHDFPSPFVILSPEPGVAVPSNHATIQWSSSRHAARYVLEIENEESGFMMVQSFPPSATSFTPPAGLLRRGTTYDVSLNVEGDTDNELEVEGTLVTLP